MARTPVLHCVLTESSHDALHILRRRYPQLTDSTLVRWGLLLLASAEQPPIEPPIPPRRGRPARRREAGR